MALSIKQFKYILFFLFACLTLTTQAQSLSERLQNLRGLTGNSEQQFLHPDQAFVMSVTVDGPAQLNAMFQITEGYYLYHDQFKFEVLEGKAKVDTGKIVIPPGKTKEDPSFGSVEINTGEVSFAVPLIRESAEETPIRLQIGYQGCKDNSLCYPPIKKELELILPATTVSPAVTANVMTQPASPPADVTVISEQDEFTKKLKESSLLLSVALFFGAGLLLSVTPCVFPMIPILSGIIVGQEKTVTPAKGLVLSLVYTTAMALTYAVIGVVAAMANVNIQAAAQNVWVISIFSLVFVLLALSMFGFYEIQMPSAIQSRLTRLSNSQQGGTLSGVVIMGAVSAIIVGPCVAPPLIGALAYISQTGNEMLGGLALFAMGMGMGAPLLVIGASAGSLLPRAGGWMDTVKKIFGVGLLAVAIWFMARLVPPSTELYLWAGLFIITSVYMGALDTLDQVSGWRRLWKGLGLIMLGYGMLLLTGASTGSGNFFQPLDKFANAGGTGAEVQHLAFKRIKSVQDLDHELTLAAQNNQTVMLDFYADWCIECIRMGSTTFTEAAVRDALKNVVLLQADVTANDAADKELLTRFNIYGPPAILFFDASGHEQPARRLFGYVKTDRFVEHVMQATGRS